MPGFFVVNVEAAICRGDEWLLIQRSTKEPHAGGMLAMPGGTVEESDSSDGTLEACLRREVREEVGVTLGPRLEYVESKLFFSARGRWVINIVFLGTWAEGEPAVQDPNEVAWTGWCGFDDVMSDPRAPAWLKDSLRAAREYRGAIDPAGRWV